jgi:hypothetical protein
MQILQWNFNNTMIRTHYYLLFWMNFVADNFLCWLFRLFYLRRSSAENLIERDYLIRILFQVYFDFVFLIFDLKNKILIWLSVTI